MLTIVGCGNTNRSDDGAGVFVARSLMEFLKENPRDNVRVFDAGTGGIEVMFNAKGSKKLIIVDASSTGSEPGTIYDVPGDELIADRDPTYSLHDFRWDHALFAGKKIFKEDFPTDVKVFLIESGNLDLGLEMTPNVAASAKKGTRMIVEAIREYE